MKIFLTGASSYVGAKLYLDLKDKHEVTGSYFNNKLSNDFIKLDITNEVEIAKVVGKYSPEVIIHAAANASGEWCEKHPKEALEINEKGTEYILRVAKKMDSKVIFISSYAVHDPSLLYSRTKINSEKLVKESGLDYLILRPSFIVGYSPNTTNDRPMNRLLKNLDEGVPAIYDSSWKFYPTYLKQISEVIQTCLDKNIFNKIIPIASDKAVSRYELAKDILSPFNIEVNPEDKKLNSKLTQEDLTILDKLNLPTYTYEQMIDGIVDEIKNREKIVL